MREGRLYGRACGVPAVEAGVTGERQWISSKDSARETWINACIQSGGISFRHCV